MPVLEDVADGADADPTRGSGRSAMCDRVLSLEFIPIARVPSRGRSRSPVQIPCGENGEMWTIVKPRIKITGSGDGTVLYPTHRLTNDSRTNRTPERYRLKVLACRVARWTKTPAAR
jgi:hypothetical protein